MAFSQITATNLTPSRPAPQAPVRRAIDTPSSSPYHRKLQSSGYSATFSSGSSYSPDYTGIGGSPLRHPDLGLGSNVVRCGTVSLKEEGFASFMFLRKWLILREEALSIHKAEVGIPPSLRWILSTLNSVVPGCPPTECGTLERHHQHRTSGSEAVLFALGDQGKAIPPVSQERRGALWLAGRHLFSQSVDGCKQPYQLRAQGARWL